MRNALRGRPWVLIFSVALLPAVVTLLEMSSQLGGQTLVQLVRNPSSLTGAGPNPWLALLRPLGLSTFLLALLGWLALTLPESAAFRHRTMRIKRIAVAVLVLFAAFTLWAGIILGDLAWHVALQSLPQTGASLALLTSPWVYGFAALVTAMLLYWIFQPAGKKP